MNSVKLGIVVVVALAVGSLGGGVFARQQLGAQMTKLAQERDRAAQELEKTKKQIAELKQLASNTEATLTARNDELQRLQAAYDKLAGEQAAAPPQVPAEPAVAEATAPPPPENVPPRRGPGFRDGAPEVQSGDMQPVPPELAPGERQNFSQRMRERMQGVIDTEASKSTDPNVQQRLTTLREQSDYMLDLMQRMRDSQDEKERASLQEEFQQVRSTVTGLVQEQQDYMLRQVAVQSGITDPQKQQTFMNSIRETQSSPFFNSPMMSWGGRRGGGGGGFGGFGGGGGR